MLEEKINFKVVTPEKILYEKLVEMITFPGIEGEFSVMARHMHMIVMVLPGIIIVEDNAQKHYFLTKGGVLEILKDASLLTEEMIELDSLAIDEINNLIDNFENKLDQDEKRLDDTSNIYETNSTSSKYLKMTEELKKFITIKDLK